MTTNEEEEIDDVGLVLKEKRTTFHSEVETMFDWREMHNEANTAQPILFRKIWNITLPAHVD